MSVSSSNAADVRVQSRTTRTAFVIALSVALLGTLLPIETAQAQAKMALAVVDTSGPTQLIETSANAMVAEIEARRAELRKDPTKLDALSSGSCCPTSTSIMRRGSCSASTGVQRRPSSVSGSSTRSTAR